ncbi:hypothetical protein [Plesiomonas shigelloides]|uniref:hypothetical protein n=1 Tax=Plesiomonas shigelloides TaxID=703 RepID=UPI0032612D4F
MARDKIARQMNFYSFLVVCIYRAFSECVAQYFVLRYVSDLRLTGVFMPIPAMKPHNYMILKLCFCWWDLVLNGHILHQLCNYLFVNVTRITDDGGFDLIDLMHGYSIKENENADIN